MRRAARRRSAAAPRDRASASGTRVARPAGNLALLPVSLTRPPVEIGAHARAELRHRLDRIGADRKCPEIEIAGRTRGAPTRIFAFGRDQLDFHRDHPVTQRGNMDIELVAYLQTLDQILTQIEVDPDILQVDQGHERYARRYVFARLDIALVDLRGDWGIDDELIDDRLNALDVGIGFFDAGLGNRPLFLGVAVDRLLVGRGRLIDCPLGLVQRVGRLVEAGLRCIALLGQDARALVGLLRQHEGRLGALHFRLPRGNGLHPRADQDVGKLRVGDGLCSLHLLEFGNGFRIIDLHQHGVRRNVLAAFDGYLLDPPVDARGDIEPRGIGLALYQQRLGPQEIED